jgi:hypothetical protein
LASWPGAYGVYPKTVKKPPQILSRIQRQKPQKGRLDQLAADLLSKSYQKYINRVSKTEIHY